MRVMKLTTLAAVALLAFTACTNKGGDSADDTGVNPPPPPPPPPPPVGVDTGVEIWGVEGTATVVAGSSYTGTSTMYDEVTVNSGGNYSIGDRLCEIDYPATTGTPQAPTLACPSCTFAFNVDHATHTDITQDSNAWCDTWYTGTPILDDDTFWDIGIGWDGSAMQYYAPADGSDPAQWVALTYATGSYSGGSFTFNWPIRAYQY